MQNRTAPLGGWHLVPWLAAGALALAACSDSDTTGSAAPLDHPDVVLRDVAGDPLPAGSNAPYSPRQTCGTTGCHDVDAISGGYHFAQGRTDTSGQIDDRLTRPWSQELAVLSPGMYGKW